MTDRRTPAARAALLPLACVGLAGLSLLLPWDLSYDPWGWVVWGWEITAHQVPFTTSGYPSWKPLPVAFTTVFSLFGHAAPGLWLVVARAGSLLAVVLGYRLGARFAGRIGGVVAAAGLLLLPGWLRYFASGASEPLLVALVLAAIERHMDGHRGQALGLGFGAALLRPEAWPFLLAYSIWYGRGNARRALVAGTLMAALPVLWLVPEWIGSGDPFHGSALAQMSKEARQSQQLSQPGLEALRGGLGLALLPLSLMAILLVAEEARRRRFLLPALAAGALVWIGVVVAMTGLGYAGLDRFALPAGSIICVLGGIAVGRSFEAGGGRWGAPLTVGALLLCVLFAAPRVAGLTDVGTSAESRDELEDQLAVVIDRLGGPNRVLACGPLAVDRPFRASLAWQLGVPVAALRRTKSARLVFRARGRVLQSFDGPVHLPGLAPAPPAQAPAHIAGWDVIASVRPGGCTTPRRSVSSRSGHFTAPTVRRE